jgi:hypothetical protein
VTAKSVVVTFRTVGGSSEPDLRIEPRWWDPEVLCADSRFKMTNETGSYLDWTATLTKDEFRVINEAFRSRAVSGYYASPDWQRIIQPQAQIIDGALAGGLGQLASVTVTVFEWESGLGD